MIGAIIGDIVGSRFEFNNILSKDFELFTDECTFTDDTVMTVAVADLLMCSDGVDQDTITDTLRFYGKSYPYAGYGVQFLQWLDDWAATPYYSCGNGAAMRISPVGWVAKSAAKVSRLSNKITAVTHNHPEGLKGAEVVALAILGGRLGISKQAILDCAKLAYEDGYNWDLDCEGWRRKTKGQHGKEVCQISVPQAFACFREGTDFEDVIRNAVSIGGDTDTVAAIAGSIAEAYYGVPDWIVEKAYEYLPKDLRAVTETFRDKYCQTRVPAM